MTPKHIMVTPMGETGMPGLNWQLPVVGWTDAEAVVREFFRVGIKSSLSDERMDINRVRIDVLFGPRFYVRKKGAAQ